MLALLVCGVLGSAVFLIVLYNDTVSFQHGAAQMKAEIKAAETVRAELKEKTFALFDTGHIAQFAEERHLVADRAPQYLEISTQWALASHG